MNQTTKQRSSMGTLIPGLLVSGAAVAALYFFVDFGLAFESLLAARPWYLVAATALFAVGVVGRAATSRELVDHRTGIGGAFAALNIGYLANNLLPLRAGEVVRSVVLGRKTGTGFIGGATAVAAERMLDLVMAGTVLLSGISAVGVEASWLPAAAAATGAFVGIAILLTLARRRQAAADWLEPRIANRPRLTRLLPKLVAALDGLAQPRRLLRATMLLGASWALAVVIFWVGLLAFIPNAPVSWAAFGLGVMAFGIGLPSSPGAFGVYEATWVAALSLCGADPADALAYAISIHTLTFAFTSICGIVCLILEVPGGAGFRSRARALLSGGEGQHSRNDREIDAQ